MNERYRCLKTKEYQALLSFKGRQIFAKRKIDMKSVFGQIKVCLDYKRCHLRDKRKVRIDMGFVLMVNNLLKYNKRKRQNKKLEFRNWKSLAFCFLRIILTQTFLTNVTKKIK